MRRVSRAEAASVVGPPLTESYVPSMGHLPYWYGQTGVGWLRFHLEQVEPMLCDPQVALGTRIIFTPIIRHERQNQVLADDPRIQRFVFEQYATFWKMPIREALQCVRYGYSGAEPLYDFDQDGQMVFTGTKPLHPLDIQAGTLPGTNVFGGVLVKGGGATASNKPIPSQLLAADGPRPAKGLWMYQGNEFNGYYGRSRYESAYPPWREKNGTDGTLDIIRMWYYKNAYSGMVVRHPEKLMTASGRGANVQARDMARQIAETLKTGGVAAIPSTKDPKTGQDLWSIEWPKMNGSAEGLLDYKRVNDEDILRGLEIPDDVITGSGGYSGKKVSEDAFYTGEEDILHAVAWRFDEQVVKPLVWYNFGPGKKYDVLWNPMLPARQQMDAMQQNGATGPRLGGGNPAAGGGTGVAQALLGGGAGLPPGGDMGQAQAPENRPNQVGFSLFRFSLNSTTGAVTDRQTGKTTPYWPPGVKVVDVEFTPAPGVVRLSESGQRSRHVAVAYEPEEGLSLTGPARRAIQEQSSFAPTDEAPSPAYAWSKRYGVRHGPGEDLADVAAVVAGRRPVAGYIVHPDQYQKHSPSFVPLEQHMHSLLGEAVRRGHKVVSVADESGPHNVFVGDPSRVDALVAGHLKALNGGEWPSHEETGRLLGYPEGAIRRFVEQSKAKKEGGGSRLSLSATLRFTLGQHKYSCVSLPLPPEVAAKVLTLAMQIPKCDLGEDGVETHPHITALFGVHGQDPAPVQALLADQKPVRLTFGRVTVFPADQEKNGDGQDVLKFDIDSSDLHRLNALLCSSLEHTKTHESFVPHCTVGYVRAGLGAKYAAQWEDSMAGLSLEVGAVVFSDPDNHETVIPLGCPCEPDVVVAPLGMSLRFAQEGVPGASPSGGSKRSPLGKDVNPHEEIEFHHPEHGTLRGKVVGENAQKGEMGYVVHLDDASKKRIGKDRVVAPYDAPGGRLAQPEGPDPVPPPSEQAKGKDPSNRPEPIAKNPTHLQKRVVEEPKEVDKAIEQVTPHLSEETQKVLQELAQDPTNPGEATRAAMPQAAAEVTAALTGREPPKPREDAGDVFKSGTAKPLQTVVGSKRKEPIAHLGPAAPEGTPPEDILAPPGAGENPAQRGLPFPEPRPETPAPKEPLVRGRRVVPPERPVGEQVGRRVVFTDPNGSPARGHVEEASPDGKRVRVLTDDGRTVHLDATHPATQEPYHESAKPLGEHATGDHVAFEDPGRKGQVVRGQVVDTHTARPRGQPRQEYVVVRTEDGRQIRYPAEHPAYAQEAPAERPESIGAAGREPHQENLPGMEPASSPSPPSSGHLPGMEPLPKDRGDTGEEWTTRPPPGSEPKTGAEEASGRLGAVTSPTPKPVTPNAPEHTPKMELPDADERKEKEALASKADRTPEEEQRLLDLVGAPQGSRYESGAGKSGHVISVGGQRYVMEENGTNAGKWVSAEANPKAYTVWNGRLVDAQGQPPPGPAPRPAAALPYPPADEPLQEPGAKGVSPENLAGAREGQEERLKKVRERAAEIHKGADANARKVIDEARKRATPEQVEQAKGFEKKGREQLDDLAKKKGDHHVLLTLGLLLGSLMVLRSLRRHPSGLGMMLGLGALYLYYQHRQGQGGRKAEVLNNLNALEEAQKEGHDLVKGLTPEGDPEVDLSGIDREKHGPATRTADGPVPNTGPRAEVNPVPEVMPEVKRRARAEQPDWFPHDQPEGRVPEWNPPVPPGEDGGPTVVENPELVDEEPRRSSRKPTQVAGDREAESEARRPTDEEIADFLRRSPTHLSIWPYGHEPRPEDIATDGELADLARLKAKGSLTDEEQGLVRLLHQKERLRKQQDEMAKDEAQRRAKYGEHGEHAPSPAWEAPGLAERKAAREAFLKRVLERKDEHLARGKGEHDAWVDAVMDARYEDEDRKRREHEYQAERVRRTPPPEGTKTAFMEPPASGGDRT